MQLSKLSGSEKAAILLMCLGEEATAKVFQELSDSEVRMISRSMMTINHVPADISFFPFPPQKQGLYISCFTILWNSINIS